MVCAQSASARGSRGRPSLRKRLRGTPTLGSELRAGGLTVALDALAAGLWHRRGQPSPTSHRVDGVRAAVAYGAWLANKRSGTSHQTRRLKLGENITVDARTPAGAGAMSIYRSAWIYTG